MASSQEIYGYTDEYGEIHLSSFPYDLRYKKIAASPSDSVIQKITPPNNLPVHAYSAIVKEAADTYKLDAALLHAVIKTESGFNPTAVSPKGAIGLMQLMPATAKRFGVINPRDPADNIQGGARYLKWLLEKFNNDVALTLAAYNAGEMTVVRYGNRLPPYRETQNYVPQVLRHYRAYTGCSGFSC